ncbi:2018_t:CDS:2 [Diversispora eburnea]|uniref:2018_t:CDS:1 n=1 Tax=Diversispora eburnea TaxID=1213867 RepID=A0A9N9AKD9_9GLOM|nr:2018_t:CDS:2 [Diversispora eburnea]
MKHISVRFVRHSLRNNQKHEICSLKQQNPTLSNPALAKKFNISASTIFKILKNSDYWINIDLNSHEAQMKRIRPSKFSLLEKALVIWVNNALKANSTITGFILTYQAREFAKLLNITDFKASEEAISGKKRNKQQVTVLLCSNIPAAVHCSEESLKSEDLSNIALHPLPANTTTHLQPMDAGIIHSFKSQYQKFLVKFKIDQFNLTYNTNEMPEENIVSSSQFLEIDIPETPSFSSTIFDSTITGELVHLQESNIQEIQNLVNQLPYDHEDIINSNDYIEIDDSLQIQNMDVTNEDIIDLIQHKPLPVKKIKPKLAMQALVN